MVEDRAKVISELYAEKSKLLKALSDLSNPEYGFMIAYDVQWSMGNYTYHDLDKEFVNQVKEMTIGQYNKQLKIVEEKLNKVLTN
jgi:hypothetical protein